MNLSIFCHSWFNFIQHHAAEPSLPLCFTGGVVFDCTRCLVGVQCSEDARVEFVFILWEWGEEVADTVLKDRIEKLKEDVKSSQADLVESKQDDESLKAMKAMAISSMLPRSGCGLARVIRARAKWSGVN